MKFPASIKKIMTDEEKTALVWIIAVKYLSKLGRNITTQSNCTLFAFIAQRTFGYRVAYGYAKDGMGVFRTHFWLLDKQNKIVDPLGETWGAHNYQVTKKRVSKTHLRSSIWQGYGPDVLSLLETQCFEKVYVRAMIEQKREEMSAGKC